MREREERIEVRGSGLYYDWNKVLIQDRERELSRMELNLERRELQLEEKKLILEIAIRVNDLRLDLIKKIVVFPTKLISFVTYNPNVELLGMRQNNSI